MTADGRPLTNEAIAGMTDEQRAILLELGTYAAQELNLSKLITEIHHSSVWQVLPV